MRHGLCCLELWGGLHAWVPTTHLPWEEGGKGGTPRAVSTATAPPDTPSTVSGSSQEAHRPQGRTWVPERGVIHFKALDTLEGQVKRNSRSNRFYYLLTAELLKAHGH